LTILEILNKIGSFILLSIVPPINLFVFFYLFRSNWRSTHPGKALMYSMLSLLLLVDLSAATILLGITFPGREILRILVFGFISYSQWRLFVILIKVQHAFSKKTETSEQTRERLENQGLSDSLRLHRKDGLE
jgi:hypothetical protein